MVQFAFGFCFCCFFFSFYFGLTDGLNRTQCLLNAENGLHLSSGDVLTCDASAFVVSCVRYIPIGISHVVEQSF